MRIKVVIIFLLLSSPLMLLFALFPRLGAEGLALETSVLISDVESYTMRLRDYLEAEMRERFAVREIIIRGEYRSDKADIARVTGIRRNQWAWEVSLDEVRESVESLAWIQAADVRFDIIPMRLRIHVEEVEPWIVAELGEESWLVSNAGTLVEPLTELSNSELVMESSSLPRLSGLLNIGLLNIGLLNIGLLNDGLANAGLANGKVDNASLPESMFSSANARFHYAIAQLKLLEMAETLDYEYEVVRLQADGSLRIVAARPEIADAILLVRSLEDAKTAGLKLNLVRQDLERRGEKPNEIDLRFASQAIVR